MKKLLTIFMLLALFVSCSDDDTTEPNNDNGTAAGIYKGRTQGSFLILLSNFEGAYVSKDNNVEKFTWKVKDKNTLETNFSNGESYLCKKNTNSDYAFNYLYRDGAFTKIVGSAQMVTDKSIIGKWKVNYSNTISPVFYFKSEDELAKIKEQTEALYPNIIDWHWYRKDDMGWDQRAYVKEYNGGINETVSSYLFNESEMAIEITEDFLLKTYRIDYAKMKYIPLSTTIYRVENNKIVKGGYLDQGDAGVILPLIRYDYNLEGSSLTIKLPREYEQGGTTRSTSMYKISKYSKIE